MSDDSDLSCKTTAEPIQIQFRLWTRVGRKQNVLHGANLRNLANTTEPSMCGGDASLRQVTFGDLLL